MVARTVWYWKKLNWSERVFILLPFLILTPRLTPVIEFGHNGEVSQEMTFSLAALIAVLLLVQAQARGKCFALSRDDSRLVLCAALFTTWGLLSLLWSPEVGGTLHHAGIWITYCALILTGRTLLRRRAVLGLATVLMIVAFALSFLKLVEYWMIVGTRPAHSLMFGNFGVIPEILFIVLPLTLTTCLTARRNPIYWSSLVAAALIWAASLSTFQFTPLLVGTVIIACLVCALASGWLKARNHFRVFALLVTLAALLLWQLNLPSKEQNYQLLPGATGYDLITRKAQNIKEGRSGTGIRLVVWSVTSEMIRAHPLIGIGGGAFRVLYPEYRGQATADPRIFKLLASADDDDAAISLRSHNEFLQVFAELGIVGFVLLGIFLIMLFLRFWQSSVRSRPVTFSLCVGTLAFLISSCLTSFSFRWIPCGACFFLVINLLPKSAACSGDISMFSAPRLLPRWLPWTLAILCTGSFGFSARVLWGQIYLGQSNDVPVSNFQDKLFYLHSAIAADPYNYTAHFLLGKQLYMRGQHQEAISHLEYGVQHGLSNTFGFAQLAFACEEAGELDRAQKILQEGVTAYPTSIFIRALYGKILEKNSCLRAATENRVLMKRLNPVAAEFWDMAVSSGSQVALNELRQCGSLSFESLKPEYGRALIVEREKIRR